MEQERIEMTAALAHDLKSPLSLILAYSDALLEDYQEKDGELKNYLMVIHENAEKSADFVRQMQYTAELEKKDKGADTERNQSGKISVTENTLLSTCRRSKNPLNCLSVSATEFRIRLSSMRKL